MKCGFTFGFLYGYSVIYPFMNIRIYMSRIINFRVGNGDVKDWIHKNKPSKASRLEGTAWIRVERSDTTSRRRHSPDISGLHVEWTTLQVNGSTISKQVIKDLAKKYNITCGKWLFYVKTGDEVDRVWAKIVNGIHRNVLCSVVAKVSPATPGKTDHVICVYTDDFTNQEEVMSCERGLRGLGLKYTMYYKPDAFTYLDIYSSNPWGIKPTIFTSFFNNTQGKSQVKTN